MSYLLLSFVGGVLTVLAPCILPVLPIIIGGSITNQSRWRPLIITLSLAVSIVVFTLLLKVSSLLFYVPDMVWKSVSGVIIIILGIVTLWPDLWEKISIALGVTSRSQRLLQGAVKREGVWGMILTGAALGPVFASCSPIYFLILGTVLPISFWAGFVNLVAYGLGLAVILFVIAELGQRAAQKLRWGANPKGWLKRILGVIFIIVGLSIMQGWDKQVEGWLLEMGLWDVTRVEQRLLDMETEPNAKSVPREMKFRNIGLETNTVISSIPLSEAMVGDFTGEELEILPSSIVEFGEVKQNFPEVEVLSRKIGVL